MLELVVINEIKEGCMEHVKKEVITLVEETRKEKGCISYRSFVSETNPNNLCFVEKWESQEALDNHMETAHILNFRKSIEGMVVNRNFNIVTEIK